MKRGGQARLAIEALVAVGAVVSSLAMLVQAQSNLAAGCASGQGLLGGYSPVNMLDREKREVVRTVVERAFEYYVFDVLDFNTSTCGDSLDISVTPLAACSQVVAGTNYVVDFIGSLYCGPELSTTKGYRAQAFVPLPSRAVVSTAAASGSSAAAVPVVDVEDVREATRNEINILMG